MDYPKNYIVWDLETTGFDTKTCKVLEIGAILVVDGVTVKEKNWLLNHPIGVPANITEINHITTEMIRGGVEPEIAMNEFFTEFVDQTEFNLTHNGYRFDIPFLAGQMTDEQKEKYLQKITDGCLDSAALYKGLKLGILRKDGEKFTDYAGKVLNRIVKGLKYNVAVCCEDLQIDKSNIQLHRSLGDVYLTNEIYKKLTHEETKEQPAQEETKTSTVDDVKSGEVSEGSKNL